jgi:transposase InsO family protein
VGSRGRCHDNALAETVNGLYRTGADTSAWSVAYELEHATLEWVGWFNKRRLLKPISDIPPVE